MIFRQLFDATSSTYTCLLAIRRGGEALIIAPVLERVARYRKLIEELDLKLIKAVDTHPHADHITGLGALRDHTKCITVLGEQSGVDVVSMRVSGGDRLDIEGISLGVICTPGHTDDSCCVTLPDRVFTGDTLLIRGTGRTDFRHGSARAQYESIFNRLPKLPDETLVFPAHDCKGDIVSTIAEERAHNPRLKVRSVEEYEALMAGLKLSNPAMMDVAVPANMRQGLHQGEVAQRGWAVDATAAQARRAGPTWRGSACASGRSASGMAASPACCTRPIPICARVSARAACCMNARARPAGALSSSAPSASGRRWPCRPRRMRASAMPAMSRAAWPRGRRLAGSSRRRRAIAAGNDDMAGRPKRGTGLPQGGFALSDQQALAAAIARLPDMPQNDALDEVQSIAFDAMEAGTAKRRVELARKALAISPLRADALVVLAREEKHPAAALTLLREAVAAGEKALGPKTFAEDAGHFWGLIETRPSMRARHMLALALREAGEDEEAVAHFRDMLRLNPNDNQGIRDMLMDALLELGEDAEAEALLKRYAKDRSAAWAWSRTLLAFRRHGDGAKARKALAAALRTNPHVPPYLLGRKPMSRRLPDCCTPGEATEAVSYLAGGAKAWRAASGALAWLAAALDLPEAPPRATRARRKRETNGSPA